MVDEEEHSARLTKSNLHTAAGDVVSHILQHLVQMLDGLLKDEEPGHIDLGQLDLTMDERLMLQEVLGENGTQAEVLDYGHTLIRSTGIPGVWLIQHLDATDHLIGEFIEVNYAPEALIAVTEDVRDGRDALKARLFEAGMVRNRHKPKI